MSRPIRPLGIVLVLLRVCVQELFRLGSPDLSAITARDAETGETPLHLLVRAERPPIVQLLLDRAATLFASPDSAATGVGSLAGGGSPGTGPEPTSTAPTRKLSPRGFTNRCSLVRVYTIQCVLYSK